MLRSWSGLVPVNTAFVLQKDMLDRTYVVQGMGATLPEYNVAKALEKLGLEFDFQLSIAGGRQVAGGIVLDFMVYTVPYSTPLWVHGEHWHTGLQLQEDLEAQILTEQYFQGRLNPAVIIWESESNTEDEALQTVRARLL